MILSPLLNMLAAVFDATSLALLLSQFNQQGHLKSWALWCSHSVVLLTGEWTLCSTLSIWFAVNFALCFGTCGSVLLCLPVLFFFWSERCCSRTGQPWCLMYVLCLRLVKRAIFTQLQVQTAGLFQPRITPQVTRHFKSQHWVTWCYMRIKLSTPICNDFTKNK